MVLIAGGASGYDPEARFWAGAHARGFGHKPGHGGGQKPPTRASPGRERQGGERTGAARRRSRALRGECEAHGGLQTEMHPRAETRSAWEARRAWAGARRAPGRPAPELPKLREGLRTVCASPLELVAGLVAPAAGQGGREKFCHARRELCRLYK